MSSRTPISLTSITRIVNDHPTVCVDELLPSAYVTPHSRSKTWPENSAYGATVLDCAATTGGSPVAMQDHAFVLGCKGIGELLACGTNVNVLISHITEVLLAKRPSAFAFEVIGLGNVTVMPASSHARISSLLK